MALEGFAESHMRSRKYERTKRVLQCCQIWYDEHKLEAYSQGEVTQLSWLKSVGSAGLASSPTLSSLPYNLIPPRCLAWYALRAPNTDVIRVPKRNKDRKAMMTVSPIEGAAAHITVTSPVVASDAGRILAKIVEWSIPPAPKMNLPDLVVLRSTKWKVQRAMMVDGMSVEDIATIHRCPSSLWVRKAHPTDRLMKHCVASSSMIFPRTDRMYMSSYSDPRPEGEFGLGGKLKNSRGRFRARFGRGMTVDRRCNDGMRWMFGR